MSRIYVPSQGANSWQALLADPQKHWRMGYSARSLANCWETANGVPAEVARLFPSNPELLLAIPEHKVPLPRGRESQSDLFALLKVGQQICSTTIEGKVDESFDRLVSEWLIDASRCIFKPADATEYANVLLSLLTKNVAERIPMFVGSHI